MPLNLAGLSGALNDIDTISLHSTNPGLGVSPAAGELTSAPYARKAASFGVPTDVSGVATSALSADVTFPLHLSVDQNVQFVGLWKGGVYKGYAVPLNPFNFTGTVTSREFKVTAASTKLTCANA